MSRSHIRSFITQLFLFVAALAVVGAVLVVSGQNSNSSTTMQSDNMSASNMSGTKRSSSKRRGRRRGKSMASTPAACGPMQENTNMAGAPQESAASAGSMNAAPVRTGRCDPNTQEQTDLSGTYTGTVNYSEGGMSGDATLTITGNDFTLTSGSTTQEGRVVAVTTCNYTAVSMTFGKGQSAGPLPIVSLRAKKAGNNFTLMSVSGEKREFSFSAKTASTASAGGAKRRRRARKPKSKMSGNACNPMAHPVVSR